MTAILDTHLHLVDRSRLTYPWIAGAGAGTLDRDWSHAEYAAEAAAAGITRALHLEGDMAENMIGAETELIDSLSARHDVPIAGIISACRPENDGFAAEIERAQSRPSVVGSRRVLHVMPDALSQTALVDAAPETQFVLDHCGVPDIAGGGYDDWARDIGALALRENVVAKISGLPAYAMPGWQPEDLRRWVYHVAECFWFDRLVWGSDWFVCTLGGELTKWVTASRALLDMASDEERAAVFSGNAQRIWNLPAV